MTNVGQAIADWRVALGAAAISTDTEILAGYQLNTSEFSPRELLAVLRPSSLHEVQQILAVARSSRIALYPISTGRNWGFGSALPVRGPAALVDLGRMDRILEVDPEFGYAVFETGVTQGKLADHLVALGGTLKLNVTGAGRDTSIVGNLLDHGVGNLGPRIDDLLGVEAVLGNGEVVRTGLWHLGGPAGATHHYPPGLGPDLRGLFVQSSFGIVTKVALRLHPVTPFLELTLEIHESKLATFVDELRRARDDGIVNEYARITDAADSSIRFFSPSGPATWKSQVILRGTRGMRVEAQRELERRFDGVVSRIDGFDTECDRADKCSGDDRSFLEARLNLKNGIPSNRSLERIAGTVGKSLEDGNASLDRDRDLPGFLCVNVSLPFCGKSVAACSTAVRAAAAEAGIKTSRFFGVVEPMALSGFFPFYFDRRSGSDIARAHAFKDELSRRLEAVGAYPMRIDIDSMAAFTTRTGDGFWRSISAIKQALDPQGVISPGHYCATPQQVLDPDPGDRSL
jgi:4-cresol dehydrogenase (hydroxylating) flavoprotein subunit